jgi:tetratricopeptide (TPR) repeat protein
VSRPNTQHRKFPKLVATLAAALCAAVTFFAADVSPLYAQSSSGAVSPQVAQLYSEAKAAQAQGDYAGAIQKYEAILKAAPRLAPAYNNLGLLYYNQGDYAHAASVLKEGLQIDQHMTSASALLGTCLFAQGNFEEARKPLEAALRGNPQDDQVEMILTRTLIQLGQNSAAIPHLQALTTRNPQNQEAWYLLGKVYLQLSQTALAKVHEIDSDSVFSHLIAGEIMDSMKNYDGALVEFNKAVQLDPQRAGVQEHLGNVYWEMGNWPAARQAFMAELSNRPSDCDARWKAANCLLEEHGSPDEALQQLNQAIQQCGTLTQAKVDRARALIQLGRASDALPDLVAAEKETPDEPSIHFLLATVYRAQHLTADFEREMKIYGDLQQSATQKVAQRAAEVEALKKSTQ